MNNKAKALAEYLKVDEVYADPSDKNYYKTKQNVLEPDFEAYMIYTDAEATEAAMETIKDMPWFLPIGFLADYAGLPDSVFSTLEGREEKDAILALVELRGSFESFALTAIDTVGRGYLLSPMLDDREIELANGFYAYQVT